METNNEHILRRRMEKRLGRPISDAAWARAEQEGYVSDALGVAHDAGEDDLFDYLAAVLTVRDRAPAPTPKRAVRPTWLSDDLGARIAAVSRLVGEEAAGDEWILGFRRRVLARDTPMGEEEALAYLDLPEARQSPREVPDGRGRLEVLKYQDRRLAYEVHVGAGSALDQLRTLSERLATSYPWQPDQAAAFVLEGLIPLATPFMVHVPQAGGSGHLRRVKVVVEVDAWIPAEAVLRAYREVQRKVLPGHNRPISRRSIDLVNFVVHHPPATWPARLALWNNEHPEAPYSDYRHMRFAFDRARRALLQPSYRFYAGPRDDEAPGRSKGRRPPRSKEPRHEATAPATRSS